MNRSRYITRKEIAAANELSPEAVRLQERRLRLNECRDKSCARPVRYHRERAAENLRRHDWQVPE